MIKRPYLAVLLVAFVCALLFKTFFIEGFVVKGDSMAPNIMDGDYVFINKLAYKWSEPMRGEIIVALPRENSTKIVKRIVGLPGERLQIENGHIVLRMERTDVGTILEEPYLGNASTTPAIGTTLIQLDPQEYFALGDNRGVSIDSRELGPIDKWQIKGKVFALFRIKNFKFITL